MKNRILATLLGTVILVASCSLDEEPYGFYSEDNFFKTAADAEAAVNYAYGTLTFLEYSRLIFFLGDMTSETETTKGDASVDNQDLNNWKVENLRTNGSLENYFKYAFIGINRANAVIKKVPEADFDQDLKDQFLGEAYFLRAWNYFNLVRNFGLVPLHSTVVETLDQTSSPLATSMDAMYDLILSDCRLAVELMGVYSAPRIGRADKAAAQSLAAKAYLYVASAKEHGVKLYTDMQRDVTMMYDSAAYYAGQVIDNQSTYGFDNDLLAIYDVEKPNGPEHIFLMGMDRTGASEGQYSKISKMFLPYIDGATLYLKQGDAEEYIPTHDGWGEYRTEIAFYNSFDANDKRKTHLIVDKVYDAAGNVKAEFPGTVPYPFSRKFVDPKFDSDKTSTRPFLIRYSDVALIYAEAVGPTPKAMELVNFIRNRAGLGNLNPNLSKEAFREEVWKERKFELAFEGDRMYDIRRFNRIQSVVEQAAALTDDQVAFYPIPQAEINLNGSIQ